MMSRLSKTLLLVVVALTTVHVYAGLSETTLSTSRIHNNLVVIKFDGDKDLVASKIALPFLELQYAAAEASMSMSGSFWPGHTVVQLNRVQTWSNGVVDDTFRYAVSSHGPAAVSVEASSGSEERYQALNTAIDAFTTRTDNKELKQEVLNMTSAFTTQPFPSENKETVSDAFKIFF